MRPKFLSSDNTPIYKVILNVVNNFKSKMINFDEIWCLMPCAPNIKFNDLIDAANFYKKRKNYQYMLFQNTKFQ